jgi:hypothetical protein
MLGPDVLGSHMMLDTVPAPSAQHAPPSFEEGEGPPRWLRLVAFLPAAAVLAFGSVGLLLAINGWYRPAVVFPLGAGVWVFVVWVARPAFASVARASISREARVCAALGVVAIVAITAWNMANSSEHVLIDRDGGSYANTARWIARDGSLSVKPRVGPFAQEPTVGFDSLAVFQMPNGSLQFQFAHLLPAVLAESYSIAGNSGLFHTPELLGGIALLAFFVLAWRLLRRPLFALSAMLALAFLLPEVSFARDSYSEIPSQILLFTALWLLASPRVLPRGRLALVAGFFLGALEAARIDAIVFLIGVPVICAVAWLRSPPADRRRITLPSILALLAGIAPGLALGLVDVVRHSGSYYTDLRSDVRKLSLATAASAVACVVVVVLWRFVFPYIRRLPWKALSTAAAAGVVLLGFAVWAFRPRLQIVRGDGRAIVGLQKTEHVAVDATRLYFERSLSWMSWYLGPLTLALAIVGAGLLVRALLLGRMTRTVSVLSVLLPGSLLYLYKARAVPDHVWVTRRFLVSALPILVLLGLGMAAYLAAVSSTARWSRFARAGGVGAAIVAVAFPVYTVVGVRSMAEETGYLGIVEQVCHDIGPHAAVVVLEASRTDGVDDWIPQALRGWCGAEVGITRGPASSDALHRLARDWRAQGRALFVASSSYGYVQQTVPDAPISPTRRAVDHKLLEPTLTHRPDAYTSQSLAVVVARIPPE